MSNPCGAIDRSPYGGSTCQFGYKTSIFISENQLSAITDANAILEATWTALLLADQPARLYFLQFDINEFDENEVVEEEFDDGSKFVLDIKQATSTHKMVSSSTALRSIYKEFRDGKTMYAYWGTSKGYFVGKEVTANTIQQVKVRVTAGYEEATKDNSEKVLVFVQPLEDWKQFQKAIDPTDNFDISGLSSVQNMTFTAGTLTTTTVPLTVKDLDGVGITSLTTGAGSFFRFYNLTTDPTRSTPIVPSGCTLSGSTYTCTIAAQSSSDDIESYYLEPSATSEYYDLLTAITATIP
jgi:hypothetical protein